MISPKLHNIDDFRKNSECWKLAFTEGDIQCPNEAGTTWKYKVKKDAPVSFLDADDGLEVICEGGITVRLNTLITVTKVAFLLNLSQIFLLKSNLN